MKRQTYLLRKAGRYYFRRRLPCRFGSPRPITLSLGTAEPAEAGRLARRLAVTWDELSEQMRDVAVGERRTLSADEQLHFFRKGLKEELEHATRHLTDPQQGDAVQALHSKILSTAYRIIGSIDDSAEAVTEADIAAQLDATWTPSEIDLLKKTLAIYVTPTSVCRSDIKDGLAQLKVPINAGTVTEARWHIFRGKSEAQHRALLADHDLFRDHPIPALGLCDDDQVRAARTAQRIVMPAVSTAPSAVATEPPVENETLFAKVTSTRFDVAVDMLVQDHDSSRDHSLKWPARSDARVFRTLVAPPRGFAGRRFPALHPLVSFAACFVEDRAFNVDYDPTAADGGCGCVIWKWHACVP